MITESSIDMWVFDVKKYSVNYLRDMCDLLWACMHILVMSSSLFWQGHVLLRGIHLIQYHYSPLLLNLSVALSTGEDEGIGGVLITKTTCIMWHRMYKHKRQNTITMCQLLPHCEVSDFWCIFMSDINQFYAKLWRIKGRRNNLIWTSCHLFS